MLEKLFSNTKITAKALDATWLRNDAIAQNIANVDTPGYKRKTVKFEEYLSDAIDGNGIKGNLTDKRHIPIGTANVDDISIQVTEDNKSLSTRLDGNNVDIENEMALMAKNTIQYNTLIQRISGQFKTLRSVIKEGR
jgi:flagellar basal-body rod protein FlgB